MKKSPLVRIKALRHCMCESEHIVADFLLDQPDAVLDTNIKALAAKLHVSTATIVRFCKHLGFTGYREFRQALICELAMYAKKRKPEDIDIASNDDIAEKITYNNTLSLQETGKLLDMNQMKKCVDLIQNSKRVLLFGIGESLSVAKDAYLRFLKFNKHCLVVEDRHAQLLIAKNSTKEDVGVVISYSGETKEMVECVQALKENGTSIIAITKFAPSTISSISTSVLCVFTGESTSHGGLMSSRIAMNCVIDILCTAYASRNYAENMWDQ